MRQVVRRLEKSVPAAYDYTDASTKAFYLARPQQGHDLLINAPYSFADTLAVRIASLSCEFVTERPKRGDCLYLKSTYGKANVSCESCLA